MTSNLFDDLQPGRKRVDKEVPLPEVMRPSSLDEVVGLRELLGPGEFLRTAIEEDRVPSLIFWGPPGSGKTTLGRIIARVTKARFVPLSATSASIKDIKAMMEDARKERDATGRRTIIFIDEIHRFNKAQQDAFLPYVEAGDITLLGATTENPSFEINSALLSRAKVIVLQKLEHGQIREILHRAMKHESVIKRKITLSPEALDFVSSIAGGDARQALNSLELVITTSQSTGQPLSREEVARILHQRSLVYDKSGEEHYNIISALHKSIRNSDADAAVYWLVRMLEGGEEPMYIARRLVRAAAEDVGLADPEALKLGIAAKDAVHFLGMPEAGIVLAELAVYLCQAPKSNAIYTAYSAARGEVRNGDNPAVPHQIRNAATSLMKELGYGKDYQYAHDFDEFTTGLVCLPDSLAGRVFYEPRESGREKEIGERLKKLKDLREKMRTGK
ncbi:MAG TPA: replication-associated recombination protein A [Thermoanaerobaculia bacterium]|nr:replication-associated recombination protein A [Thermoanaerobaculia bacterium]